MQTSTLAVCVVSVAVALAAVLLRPDLLGDSQTVSTSGTQGSSSGGTSDRHAQTAVPFHNAEPLPVPVRDWDPQRPFVDWCLERDRAVVLHNTRLHGWPALHKWTPEYWASLIPEMEVHVSTHQLTRMHSAVQPLNKTEGVTWTRPFELRNISAATLFAPNPPQDEFYVFMGDTESLPEELEADTQPREFITKPEQSFVGDHSIMAVHTWIGRKGTTSTLHYDLGANFYLHTYGKKTFTLYHPDDWQSLYLYPRIHPSARMSQVQWDKLGAPETHDATAQLFPAVADVVPYQVTLEPGDLLYIPPYWGHHVAAASDISISCSVHVMSTAVSVREHSIAAPVPCANTDPLNKRLGTLRYYFKTLMRNPGEAHTYLRTLVEQRFSHFAVDPFASGVAEAFDKGDAEFAEALAGLESEPTDREVKGSMRKKIAKQAKALNAIAFSKLADGPWAVEFGNYMEDVICYVMGPTQVRATLNWLADVYSRDPVVRS